MGKSKTPDILWLDQPEEHDYPAAVSYLSIIYPRAVVSTKVKALREAEVTGRKAKDIFRASGLAILTKANFHVRKDRKKLLAGEPVSPLLLVQDAHNGRVTIADGYHRMCAIYELNEDADIHCKIV